MHKGSVGVKIFVGKSRLARFLSHALEARSTDISWNLASLGAELHFNSYMYLGFPAKFAADLLYTVTDVCLSTLFLHMRICPACLGSL